MLIIGGGPAGLTAGMYGARFGLDCLIVESQNIPSQATLTSKIENIPGIPSISGFDFVNNLKKQVKDLGIKFAFDDIKGMIDKNGLWEVYGERNYIAPSMVIATGQRPKRLNVQGEERLIGRGVSYCATCDGPFFAEKDVAVVGGGNSALEEALFLTKFARKVFLIHRRDEFRGVKIFEKNVFSNKNIEVIFSSCIDEILGDNKVECVLVKDLKTGKIGEIKTDGVFIFVGSIPNTEFVKDLLYLDDNGYIVCDEEMRTSKRGIFGCGDVREKSLRQIVTACSDGAIASHSAHLYLKEREVIT